MTAGRASPGGAIGFLAVFVRGTPLMSESVAYKVRCAACGKSLRVTAADAGTQTLCRACGARLEVPAPPMLPSVAAGEGDVVVDVVSVAAVVGTGDDWAVGARRVSGEIGSTVVTP